MKKKVVNIILQILVVAMCFSGTIVARAAGDLNQASLTINAAGLGAFATFSITPPATKKYKISIASNANGTTSLWDSGPLSALSTTTSSTASINTTLTTGDLGMLGLTAGTTYYFIISDFNPTTSAKTVLASHSFVYAATYTNTWTEPPTDHTFDGTLTATIQIAGDRATVNLSAQGGTRPASVVIEYGGSLSVSSGQSTTIVIQPDGIGSYEITGLQPLTTYTYAVRDADTATHYYINQRTFVTGASGSGYDLSSGATAAPTCEAGTDGYCLLAPIDGLTVIHDSDLENYISTVYKILIAAAAVLAIVMIFWGGVQYMTTDAWQGKNDGKKRIQNAIIGLIMALASYAILNTVNPNLLNFTFGVDKIDIAYDAPAVITFMSGGGEQGVPTITSQPTTTYDTMLAQAAQQAGLECTLVKAFMMTESGGNPNATSSVGARGLLQLMPSTAQSLGVDPSTLFDPQTNINAGVRLIKSLMTTACNGGVQNSVCNVSNIDYVIAAYNAGPGANRKSKSCQTQTLWECTANAGYQETRNYVPKVKGNYNTLKANNWGC